MGKYAAIDIGSNTLLLLIVDDESGELVSVVDQCEFGRLGQGLANSSELHPDAISRSLAIVSRFRKLMDQHELDAIGCVATQALREADNREAFIAPAQKLLGCDIELIAGEREAQLVAKAVFASFPQMCQARVLTVDVGGASTEFILSEAGTVSWVRSIPIGAVKLTERYLKSDPPTPEESEELLDAIDTSIGGLPLPQEVSIVGSAGTATAIASIAQKLESYQPSRLHGYTMSGAEVESTLDLLLSLPVSTKKSLPGLEPRRADVVAAGVAIYDRVLKRCNAKTFVISNRGLRWGLAQELVNSAIC